MEYIPSKAEITIKYRNLITKAVWWIQIFGYCKSHRLTKLEQIILKTQQKKYNFQVSTNKN